jgi:hypothetical protein
MEKELQFHIPPMRVAEAFTMAASSKNYVKKLHLFPSIRPFPCNL